MPALSCTLTKKTASLGVQAFRQCVPYTKSSYNMHLIDVRNAAETISSPSGALMEPTSMERGASGFFAPGFQNAIYVTVCRQRFNRNASTLLRF